MTSPRSAGRSRDREAAKPSPSPTPPLLGDLAIMAGAAVAGTAIAEAVGATNLGTALAFGTIAFVLATLYVMLKR